MEVDEYLELQALLSKLRVNCLKRICELDAIQNDDNMTISRKEKEKKLRMIRNIDSLKKQMPLKIGECILQG